MKNTKYIILTILMIISISFGCEDSLKEVPYSSLSVDNLYQNEEDVRKALMGMYEPLRRPGVGGDFTMTSMQWMGASHWGTRVGWRRPYSNFTLGPSSNMGLIENWQKHYETINVINSVIDNVIKTPEFSEEKLNQAIAEAKFLRAHLYFNLVRWWGGVPLITSQTVSIDDKDVQLEKASIEDVYNQIIEDLSFAETWLPNSWSGADGHRPTAGSAKSYLGKVYLTMAGKPLEKGASHYKLASDKLFEVIDNKELYGYDLVDNYAELFGVENELNSEVIFALSSIPESGAGTVLTFFNLPPGHPGAKNGGQYHYGVTQEYYDSYEPGDTRRDVTWIYEYDAVVGGLAGYHIVYNPDPDVTTQFYPTDPDSELEPIDNNIYESPNGIALGKLQNFDPGSSNFDNENDIVLLRYADVLLMYAEALNEQNKPDVALEYLNMIRDRANLDDIPTATKEEFFEILKIERWHELSGEYTEYFDILRWGTLEEEITKSREAQNANIVYDPKFELYPIPSDELNRNPSLKQNAGW